MESDKDKIGLQDYLTILKNTYDYTSNLDGIYEEQLRRMEPFKKRFIDKKND